MLTPTLSLSATEALAADATRYAPTTAALFTPAQRQALRQAITEGRLNLLAYVNTEADSQLGCMLGLTYAPLGWEWWPPVNSLAALPPVAAGRLTLEQVLAWEASTLTNLSRLHDSSGGQLRPFSGQVAAAYLDAADAYELANL